MTAAVTSAPEFKPTTSSRPEDWAALAKWAEANGHVFDAAQEPRQFSGGVGNLNYLIMFDGHAAVLRRPPPGPTPKGANDMARELRLLRALEGQSVPTPRAFAFCSDVAVLGAPFMISEYCEGRVIRGAAVEVSPEQLAATSAMLIEQLAKLHHVNVEAAGLADLGKPEGFAARTLSGWTKRALAANDGALPAQASHISAWLEANLPDSGNPPCLLHNDFKLDNIILNPGNLAEPIAIIDWDMATLGDPLFDLATLLSYWTSPGDPPALLMMSQMPSALPGFLAREKAVELYATKTGADLSHFAFYRVLAQFKLVVVVMQLHARYRQSPEVFPQFAPMSAVADVLLTFCGDLVDGKRF